MHPTAEQSELLTQHAGVCRLVWNLALEQRRDHWRQYQATTGNVLNYIAQSRELTLLRASFDFVREVSQNAQERVLKDLDQAYQKAFRGLGGFPEYKRKGAYEAFTIGGRYVALKRLNKRWGLIKLAKVGWVKIRMPRDVVGSVTRQVAEPRCALHQVGIFGVAQKLSNHSPWLAGRSSSRWRVSSE